MAISAGNVYSELILDGSKYFSTLEKAEKQMNTFSKKLEKTGKSMEKAGKSLSKYVTAPVLGLGAAALKVGTDFQSGMSEVQAISGATGDDLAKLEAKAKEMGATTKFSASEAAEALKYMAMAGWDTNQMLDGLDGVMMLAAASGEDLALTSDIVTDALTAFGMEAKDASQFADLLASASSNSNTNVAMLGESFKYVAPLFGSLGYSAEDAALALGLMANAGIKGSQAGTTLRAAITNLANPTDKMAAAMNELGISITDANGEMLPFKDVMDQLREKFAGLTEEQQAQYAATIFGKEAMSGMLAIINASETDYNKLTTATRDYNGAAKEMADTMQDNLQGQLTRLKSQLEGVGIQLAEILIPIVSKVVGKISEWVDKFASLDSETQKTIVKMAGLAAAIGPVLMVGGKMANGISSIIGLFAKFKAASTAASTAATAATSATATGFSLAGAAAKAGALLLNPWVLGIAAATAGGIALYKHLSKESIPTIELFGDEVSESTKKAVGGFLELNDEATLALNQLSWSGQEVTKEMADGITANFSQMASEVQAGLDKHHEESLGKIQNFVTSSTSLSKTEQDEILNNMQEGYENRKKEISDGEARIKEILDTASSEKRALTKSEQEEINSIQKKMVDTGIKVLSENEVEAKAIMERMKAQAGEITAKQAAEVVKNSLEQKDKTIKAAEEQYKEVVKEIIRQRDESKTITKDQADKLIKEATRQKDESIKNAEEMHKKVVDEAKVQAKEHVNQVDWETGEIKTKWQVMKDDIQTKAKEIKEDVINRWEEIKTATSEKWNNIKTDVANSWSDMKRETFEKVKDIWSEMTSRWEEIYISTKENWGNIRTSVANSINNIKDKIDEGIEKIKEWNATKVKEKVFTIVEQVKRVFSSVGSNARGTNYWRGGLTWVGEEGPELIDLPRGTKIYSNPESIRMAQAAAESLNMGLSSIADISNQTRVSKTASPAKGGDIHQHIIINSPTPLTPSEIARKNLQVSRQLAMEWGL